ncbi:hypothetical protein PYCCODRAFT_1361559 [Trametes coccinea BRFM310]|uniref:Uncharacterized protein n=1 Tax=Trametes coccinea (strain BRFM310) TaxID=1353009 RepID=A0A1Y2IWP6_TRAC3|nr:hypothetical protein PYCCODRAFT_1361559 [Trametes coccinea BRFM310]
MASALQHSESLDSQYARRRRVSVSGKLLSLFGSKPKESAPPTRPTISRPMPLERRVPTSHSGFDALSAHPPRRKRDYREASLDSDDAPDNSDAHGEDRRATSRPRLDSDVSADGAIPTRPVRPLTHAHPLKSALKKTASESDPSRSSPAVPVGKGLLFPRVSHSAKVTLRPARQHNRAHSEPSPSLNMPSRGRVDKKDAQKTVRLNPSSSESSNTTTAGQNSRPTHKKTVTFADEEPPHTMVALRRSKTSDDVENVWMDQITPVDVIYSTPVASSPTHPAGSPHARPANPRRKSDPTARISAKSARAFKPLPAPPLVDTRRMSAIQNAAKAVIETNKEADARAQDEFRMKLARQAPPTPASRLKNDPFKLPVSWQGSVQLKQTASAVQGNGARAQDLLDEVLQAIARDREERERGRTVPKSIFTPVTQSDVLRRFSVDMVPDERHTTIWDGKETDIYAWSCKLVVRDAKPACYFYPRHSIHDFSIQFHTVDEPRSDPHTFDPHPSRTKHEWQATYNRHRVSAASKGPSGVPTLDPAHGIVVETDVRLLPGNPDGPSQWEVRFWVPVPVRLLMRVGHRTFVCRAKVTVKDWETPQTEVPAGCIAIGIERLRSERLLGGMP